MKIFFLLIWHLITLGNTCIECGKFLNKKGICNICDDIEEE